MADAKRLKLGLPWHVLGLPSFTNFTQNQTTDASEFIFQVPAAWAGGAITRVWIKQGTLTGTAPVFRVSLQGVNTSGNPDGTIKASTNAFVDYTPTAGNNNTGSWLTLGTSYTPSSGEFLSVVIAYQSGTIDGSNNCTFGNLVANGTNNLFPYAIQNDATVRTKQTNGLPYFGWGTASVAYGAPVSATSTLSYNSGSTPDEWAMAFSLPANVYGPYQVLGVRFLLTGTFANPNTVTIALYDGTTVLQNVTYPTEDTTSSGGRFATVYFDESSLSVLTPGTVYRLGFAPSAVSQSVYYIDVAAAADMAAFLQGTDFYAASRVDAGAWTDLTTRRLFAELILADVVTGTKRRRF